jgi:hypothetical protein
MDLLISDTVWNECRVIFMLINIPAHNGDQIVVPSVFSKIHFHSSENVQYTNLTFPFPTSCWCGQFIRVELSSQCISWGESCFELQKITAGIIAGPVLKETLLFVCLLILMEWDPVWVLDVFKRRLK